jgi:heme O synthase-like polyprenyltransferase
VQNSGNNLIKNGSLNFKEILRRIFLGSMAGAFLGILEIWFYEFSVRHAIAALCAGAVFGAILGLFGQLMSRKAWSAILLGAISGALAGAVWWLIVRPDVNIIFSAIIGIAFACMMVGFERPWNET